MPSDHFRSFQSQDTDGDDTDFSGRFDSVGNHSWRSDPVGSGGMGSIPLQPGEMIDEGLERPLSAPPPPGFGGRVEERNRLASEFFWGNPSNSDIALPVSGAMNGATERMTSFTSLEAVLGTSLVESMEDATRERNFQGVPSFDGKDEMNNYIRQKRHVASRLVGASPPLDQNHLLYQTQKATNPRPPEAAFNVTQSSAFSKADVGAFSQVPGTTVADKNCGFPPSLSSPHRNKKLDGVADEKRDALRGSTTPVQMYAGQAGPRRNLPPKHVGVNIPEPDDEPQPRSFSIDVPRRKGYMEPSGVVEIDRGFQKLLSSNANVFKPSSAAAEPPSGSSSVSDSVGGPPEISPRQAEMELIPFLWDVDPRYQPSRTLAILHASVLRVPGVRSACEEYGATESFRVDYASKGIFFVSYYDIRSAQYAAKELQPILQRLSVMQQSREDVVVRYCVPLNSSSKFDESQILITELPPEVNEHALWSLSNVYGVLRSVIPQGSGSFLLEFQNVQHAKEALLELESTQPWGPGVSVEAGVRSVEERQRGKDLLAMLHRWRSSGMSRHGSIDLHLPKTVRPPTGMSWQESTQSTLAPSSLDSMGGGHSAAFGTSSVSSAASGSRRHEQVTTQLVLGPDGRYTQVLVPNNSVNYTSYNHPNNPVIDPRHQHVVHAPNGHIYITSTERPTTGSSMYMQQQQQHGGSSSQHEHHRGSPYHYSHSMNDGTSQASGRSHRSGQSANEDRDNRHLMLDLEAVENNTDTRTSLMVRNIPNKYTQQMLLSEFEENGHGPGVIDFFYLPIDFKNRCNRGYAFINFVDHKDILEFHRRYYGKHWRTFNSDKICDITYARIQGKAKMLNRFENSALMEKDDEYKPLVFVSSGEDKGKRMPFPDPRSA